MLRRPLKGSGVAKSTPHEGNHFRENAYAENAHNRLSRTANPDAVIEKMKADQAKRRAKLVLWRKPVTTTHYFICELLITMKSYTLGLLQHRLKVFLFGLVVLAMGLMYVLDTPLQPYMQRLEVLVLWCLYWVGLGILSSVGLGTGLHTFLLYLGPFIASVTLAAFTCNSLNFPSPPYPNDIICPDEEDVNGIVTFWAIMSKVRLEACMWGAGTALGELPPYFFARTARLSGSEGEDSEIEEIESLLSSDRGDCLTRAKKAVYRLVQKVGFFGILLCASIPNPLFDLAGITCGHFLVPFWTFFGATLIGKAIIKTHIQKVFVILAFSEHHVELAVDWIGNIPYIGPYIQSPFSEYLEKQKRHLHRKPGDTLHHDTSRLQQVFGYFLLVMIVYFFLSIVNSMAQDYAKRLDEEQIHRKQNS